MESKRIFKVMWENSYVKRFLAVIFCIAAILFLFSSCATKRIEYVDREVVKYKTKIEHDTLIQHTHDSVLHTIIQKGDTVFDTQYIVKTRYQDRVVYKVDTCYRDSIQTQVKESIVEKEVIPHWCYFCIAITLICLIYLIYRITRWLM